MPQPSQSLPLSREAPNGAAALEAAYAHRLWLAVHLPHLVIEAVADPAAAHPQVVVETKRGRAEVVAADAAAGRLGIHAGLALGAAYALADSLEVVERSPHAERERLEALAAWSGSLTSLVSIEPPDGVLLEIASSLKLFGGVAPIKTRVADELHRRGLSGHSAAAPTPLGALWLARGGCDDAPAPDGLPGRIGALPVEVTGWPDDVRRLLAEMGVATLGECLRLSRAGFARRIGREYLHDLDRATCRRPDPRAAYAPPPRFEHRIELPEETRDSALLLEAVRRLLESLGTHLRTRQLQAGCVEVVLHHRAVPSTVHVLRPARPTHRAERLLTALALGLERRALPAGCVAVSLAAEALEPARLEAPELFGRRRDHADAGEASIALIENLRSRLGAAEVHGLALVADHRPERVWGVVTVPGAGPAAPAPVSPWIRRRPLWLLREPLPLEHAPARYGFSGPLEVERGPERIEAGWWDGDDVRRDYFIAAARSAERLWIYRDRRTGGWYLHGIFA